MDGQRDPRPLGPPMAQPYRGDARPPGAQPSESPLRRFLGGSPVAVFVRLLMLSVLVGAGMAMLGLTPGQLFRQAYEATRALIAFGLDAFDEFGNWILAGALVVVPLWLISRFLAMNRS